LFASLLLLFHCASANHHLILSESPISPRLRSSPGCACRSGPKSTSVMVANLVNLTFQTSLSQSSVASSRTGRLYRILRNSAPRHHSDPRRHPRPTSPPLRGGTAA
jgi:hypothetical protein